MSPRSQCFINWEPVLSKPSRTQLKDDYSRRFANAFLNNHWRSDISFYIPKDDTIIPAHSLIVAPASPVLERICFGFGELGSSAVITVPDIYSAEEVLVLLQFLYQGGEVEDYLDDACAVKLLMLAEYFEIPILKNQCIDTLQNSLSLENVCSRFNLVHDKCKQFAEICMDLMQNNTSEILENGSAMLMCDDALKKLLDKDRLNIVGELELVKCFLEWAKLECSAKQIEPNAHNLRTILDGRLGLIRFTTMKIELFGATIKEVGKGLLLDSEISSIVQSISFGVSEGNIKVGSKVLTTVPRSLIEKTKKTEKYKLRHTDLVCRLFKIKETIDAPFPNKKTWLTGLELGDSNPPTLDIINATTSQIIHKYIRGSSTQIMFAEPLPLDYGTNGQWILEFKSTDESKLNLRPMNILAHRSDCLDKSQKWTYIKTITFEYEE